MSFDCNRSNQISIDWLHWTHPSIDIICHGIFRLVLQTTKFNWFLLNTIVYWLKYKVSGIWPPVAGLSLVFRMAQVFFADSICDMMHVIKEKKEYLHLPLHQMLQQYHLIVKLASFLWPKSWFALLLFHWHPHSFWSFFSRFIVIPQTIVWSFFK